MLHCSLLPLNVHHFLISPNKCLLNIVNGGKGSLSIMAGTYIGKENGRLPCNRFKGNLEMEIQK